MLVPVPMATLSDEYRDDPAQPEDSDRVPAPEPRGFVRRVLDRLGRSSAVVLAHWPRREIRPELAHRFQETNDPGIGAVASGTGSPQGDQARMFGMTTAFLRGTRCAMPGCTKERHDPIHTLADA